MRYFGSFLIFVSLLLGWSLPLPAAPSAELWPYWQSNNSQSVVRIDHSAGAEFLQSYLQTLVQPDLAIRPESFLGGVPTLMTGP